MRSHTATHYEGDEEPECENEDEEGTLRKPTPLVTLHDHEREETDAEYSQNRAEIIDGSRCGLIAGLSFLGLGSPAPAAELGADGVIPDFGHLGAALRQLASALAP